MFWKYDIKTSDFIPTAFSHSVLGLASVI